MGGWYRKEIKTVADLKGLKIAGWSGGKHEQRAWSHKTSGRCTSRWKKRLDATEFVGPYDDEKLGFNKVAPYYYYPGWWEGGAELEFFINTKAYAR